MAAKHEMLTTSVYLSSGVAINTPIPTPIPDGKGVWKLTHRQIIETGESISYVNTDRYIPSLDGRSVSTTARETTSTCSSKHHSLVCIWERFTDEDVPAQVAKATEAVESQW